ncbi:hypothetical protein [Nocardia mangyaensis]|nr:hypothetical protein [Nocardia mangyaensis]MDO3648123.1 hypothetical protein [Nocardia mangyaensis]
MTDHTDMNPLPVIPAIAPSNPIDALLLQLSHLVCQLLNDGNCAIIM